jgi:hypothetical protein
VISNSLLHHLRDPMTLWSAIKAFAAPGAAVLVMDLFRPAAIAQVDQLVARYAGDAPAVLRRDFRCSLHAAYAIPEVKEQLAGAGLNGLVVEAVSDRHFIAFGLVGAIPDEMAPDA